MSDTLEEMMQLANVATIEEIMSDLKTGMLRFTLFTIFTTHDKKGGGLLVDLIDHIDDIESYITKAVKSLKLKPEDKIVESSFTLTLDEFRKDMKEEEEKEEEVKTDG